MITLQVMDESGTVLAEEQGNQSARLLYKAAYAPGDTICVTAPGENHLAVKLNAHMDWAFVYAPEGHFAYKIPSGDELRAYEPQAFIGEEPGMILARLIQPWEVLKRRNLALNPADQRGDVNVYPHATANVETRGESVFAARNAIDGCTTNKGHGDWPYQSWGIGARTDAFLMLDFGREVRVDEMALYLRADFPHDAHWTSATVVLSDGFEMCFPLERTGNRQTIAIGQHDIRWLRLEKLIKSDEPSAFPALSQLMVFGMDRMDALNQYWDMDSDEYPDDDIPTAEGEILFPEEWTNQRLAQAYVKLNLPQEIAPLVHDYFDAFAHLYGIIPLRKAFEIIAKQNNRAESWWQRIQLRLS